MNIRRLSVLAVLALLCCAAVLHSAPGAGIAPTHGNVSYGPHANNVLDFWQAKSEAPAPVVVFIHGGGFTGGDKGQARTSPMLRQCLDAGISFASINYRFRADAPIQEILHDAARAIQFIRSKSEAWHLDKTRVAAYGGSAGAGTSLWLGAHDDMADPKSADPVLRESTRLSAAGLQNGQATYDLTRWKEFVEMPAGQEQASLQAEIIAFYHFRSAADLTSEAGKRVLAECDMLGLLSAGDAPVFASCSQPSGPVQNRGHLLHHPNHTLAVQKRCREVGVECVISLKDKPADTDLFTFLKKHLDVK